MNRPALPFRLMLITDWSMSDCLERVQAALSVGPGIAIQHRHPGATDRQFYQEGVRLKALCGNAPLFINSRLDIALALDAHLHLTEHSLKAAEVRPHLGMKWLSASWHPPAPADKVDFLLVSPVFQPVSKPAELPPMGVDAFRAFAASTGTPCFALGGITASTISTLGSIAGVAVLGDIMHADSPAQAAARLLAALH